MDRLLLLKRQQLSLCKQISAHLDSFLIGTVAKSPSMSGYNITTKVDGKTITVYVRKHLVSKALEMGRRYNKLWDLVQKLSKIKWEILKMENQ